MTVNMALVAVVVLLLTGCAAPMQAVAQFYNRADACQTGSELGRPANYQRPNWCGASGGMGTITRDYNTGRYIYQTK